MSLGLADGRDQIREEYSVPDIPLSDEGRDFGTIKVGTLIRSSREELVLMLTQSFNGEKGFGFIVARKDGEEYDLPH